MSQQQHATEIIQGIWIGNQTAAKNNEFFKTYNITAVVNCTKDLPNLFTQSAGVKYMRIPIDDSGRQEDINKMTQYLPAIMNFLRQCHQNEQRSVLIHCHAGIQRSAAIVAAYLHQYFDMTMPQAIHCIVSYRPIAFFGGAHINFKESLKSFSTQLTRS